MVQQGQTFELTRPGQDGKRLWAYRYRTGGRDSKRVQRGGFASEQDARDALERELERLRRKRRITRRLTLSELVETYLDQHDVQLVTIEKLRYLLSKATAVFGDRAIGELTSQEIAAWRMTLSPGYRFEATQALRQVLHRAVAWGMIDVNPAKVGVDNPVRRRKEQHPFESWTELEALATAIGPRYGPMVLFAAATGLRPAEWIALEKRDVDRKGRIVLVRRSFTRRQLKIPKTEASTRAVPLQARALDALDRIQDGNDSPLLFPGERGSYLDIHHFRPFQWRPAQKAAGIAPLRRVYDLRHTLATFALRTLNLRPLPLHGRQPDHDRPPLRPPRLRRTRARDQAPRRVERARVRPVDAGGRSVDTETTGRRLARKRKRRLSREKAEAL
jgi:integrase